MNIQTFAWASPIPRELYLDKEAMYGLVIAGWEVRLDVAKGVRIEGPLRVRTLQFGYIDDMTIKEMLVNTELSPLWTYAIVHVSGPAMAP